MPPAAVRLPIAVGGSIQLATSLQGGQAVISVSNTGQVIPAAEVDRLFRPFERLTVHRGGDSTGYGLGLSIVAAIADAHDATIAARAQPEGGLRIQVSFPCQAADAVSA